MATGMQLIELIQAEKSDPPSGIRTLGLDGTHRWITVLEPGHVEMVWKVDDAHFNLENAVICSWTAALADQALFFATSTLCAEGEGTRMADIRVICIQNIEGGDLRIDAKVDERVGDRMFATCRCYLSDGHLAAEITAIVDIVR